MELHQLRYFCAVVRAGNFTRAAQSQHVAQPSLSQQIHKLEDKLGAKLFDRFPRFARLTESGQAFLSKAEAILRQVGAARSEIQAMSRTEVGTVSIGAIPTIAPYFLAPILARFVRRRPNVAVRIVEEITPLLLDQLHTGRVGFVLLALPIRGDEFLCEELFREPLFACLPKAHRLAVRRSISMAELRGEPFLLLKEGHCFRENALTACRRSKVHPNVVFESGQFSTIFSMVAAGIGVSVLPAMAVQKLPGCRFVRFNDENTERRVGMAQLRHRSPSRAQCALLEEIRASAHRNGGS